MKEMRPEILPSRVYLNDQILVKEQGYFWKYKGKITHTHTLKTFEKPFLIC